MAQCPQSLGCNDNIQISLDYQCFAEINPDLILEDERDACDYMVTIMTDKDVVLLETTVNTDGSFDYPVIDGAFVGAPYKASVSFLDDNGTTISCWGWFTVEDKLPPTVTCIEDFTVDCTKDLSQLLTSTNMMSFCTGSGSSDIDMNPNTISLVMNPMTGSGSSEPWELVDFVDINVPLSTMTGSGSGIVLASGDTYEFSPDPVNSDVYTGEIKGVQALESNFGGPITLVIENTPANQFAIAQGVCIEFNTVSFYTYQQSDNCDPNVEVIINKDETNNIECIDDITAQRDIEYFTRDDAGLSTGLCDFSIFFEKKDLSDIEFPTNREFTCTDPNIYTNGILDLSPMNAGSPLIDSLPITSDDNLCRINVTFSDDTFSLCGINTIKIIRKWTALDWCEGEYAQSYQTIKVEDNAAPMFNVPPNNIVFTTDRDCKAIVNFMPLDSTDQTGVSDLSDCSDLNGLNIQVLYLPGLETDPENYNRDYVNAQNIGNNIFRADQLQGGLNTIKYIFTDECGNTTEKTFTVRVIDDAPPVPICDQFTAVSIADNGWGRLYPEAIDDGSYDDCGGPVVLTIKKDTTYCADLPEYEGGDTEFGEYVSFCCQEGGLTMGVTLLVTDEGGKTNTCQVSVIVQDKTGISVMSCPQLEWDFDCTEAFKIDSTDVTGVPVIDGGCGNVTLTYEDSGSINDICGDGIITRKWFANLPGSVTELTSCEQTFNFSSDIVLNINSFTWPEDRDDAMCSNYATDFEDKVLLNGVPVDESPYCAHLSSSYTDRIFEDVSGYCIKVIRTWTVINFCVYDANLNPGQGIWSRNQIIKVQSDEGPLFTNCPTDTIFGLSNANCDFIANFDAPDAFDMCLQEDIDPSEVTYEITSNDTIVLTGIGDVVNDTLQAGTYVVTWSAEGLCNNISTCSFTFTVEDNKAPVPYCRSGITTVLTPPVNFNDEPFLEIWANDFDLGTLDNCDTDIDISFDSLDLSLTSVRFTCEDLGEQILQVWFTDDAGNQDFCTTTMFIQANGNICSDTITNGANMMISGNIKTENDEEISDVTVGLQRMTDEVMAFKKTDDNGVYAFENSPAYNNYKLNVISNDDYLNGISTLDLVLIQRHILGLQPLNSPYQIVAADINGSENITAIDLIELRKLILGIYDELPQSESWRFIDKSQVFVDESQPWPLNEEIDIYNLQSNMMLNDFVGVKVGDVNGSVELASNNNGVSRAVNEVLLTHDILSLENKNEYLIPFYLEESQDIMGMQIALQFDANAMEIVDVESGRLDLDSAMFYVEDDVLNLSWSEARAVESKNDEALFYVTVKSSGSHRDMAFSTASLGLRSELYDQDLNTVDINIKQITNEFENRLYQNVPNPFNGITTIEFELTKSGEGTLSIFGANGQIVKVINKQFVKGQNNILIDANELNGNGIYYYQLDTEYFSATRKMIFIE